MGNVLDFYMNRVGAFNTAFGHPFRDASLENQEELLLRLKLIMEEAKEVHEAVLRIAEHNMRGEEIPVESKAHLLKELADLQYVLSGFGVVFDLPLPEAFNRVHQSNMSKLGEDGKPIYREDGKVLKGPNYHEPDLDDLVQ